MLNKFYKVSNFTRKKFREPALQHFSVLPLGGTTWAEPRGEIKGAEAWGKGPKKTTEIPPTGSKSQDHRASAEAAN